MSSPTPFLPPVPAIVDELLTTKKIPALSGDEMEILCSHLFTMRDRDQRIQIAEIAYYNQDDPQALNIYLACTMPLAQRMAERRAIRIFVQPTAWQSEAMYDGAAAALLELFERKRSYLSCVPNAFRKYLMRTIKFGTTYAFRVRQENFGIQAVEDITRFSDVKESCRNPVERDLITRELLEQVTTFPHLREEHTRMLKTIAAMGPEKALRHDNCYWKNGIHSPLSKQVRRRRAMLDLPAIVEAMGVPYVKGQNLLKETRQILRDFFNRDGTLFLAS